MLARGPCKSSPDARMMSSSPGAAAVDVAGRQLRNMNGSPAKVIHSARCGGQLMIRFSWGTGPAHGPTLASDAHDKNFKLAKEMCLLASLMTTVCDAEHHCAYSAMASCSLL